MSGVPEVVRRADYGSCWRCGAKVHPRELVKATASGWRMKLKGICENGHHSDDVWNDNPYPGWEVLSEYPLVCGENGVFRIAALEDTP